MKSQEKLSLLLTQATDACRTADYSRVLELCAAILNGGGHSSELYFTMAYAFRHIGEHEKAAWALEQSFSLQANHPGSYVLALQYERDTNGQVSPVDRRTSIAAEQQSRKVALSELECRTYVNCDHLFPRRAKAKSLEMHSIENCYVLGKHRLLVSQAGNPLEEQALGTYAEHFDNHRTPLYLKHFSTLLEFNKKLSGQFVCLSGPWAENFYHWVCDFLPQVVIAESCGFDGCYLIEESNQLGRDSLSVLGIDSKRVLTIGGHCYQIEELFIPSYRDFRQMHQYDGLLNEFRSQLLRNTSNLGRRGVSRILSSRGSRHRGRKRQVENESELMRTLAPYGFKRVLMEEYSFFEQLEMMSSANACIGAHGAGMTHSLFMPPESLVIEVFSTEYINLCVSSMCRQLDHRYHSVISDASDSANEGNILAPTRQIQRILERELELEKSEEHFTPIKMDPLSLLTIDIRD